MASRNSLGEGLSAELGSSLPICTPHALSVSLPTWQDIVDYELGLDRVLGKLRAGYPRFTLHSDILKLAKICQQAHALTDQEACILFPSERSANLCREFVADQARIQSPPDSAHQPPKRSRLVRFEASSANSSNSNRSSHPDFQSRVFVLFLPDQTSYGLARTFWQHTGLGISSRFAERMLRLLGSCPVRELSRHPITSLTHDSIPSLTNSSSIAPRRYNVKQSPKFPLPILPPPNQVEIDESTTTYVEERYGRNLPIEHVRGAKLALRRRIADILVETNTIDSNGTDSPPILNLKRSERGTGQLTESDIYLYPGGMASIFYAHQLSMSLQSRLHPDCPIGKSICFGFPYTDTLKIIQKWGPGAHFFGHGEQADLEALEQLLDQIHRDGQPRIAALFCEFPSNPLLKSPDLVRLRQLADRHQFLIIIDETIGNFVNVEVIPYADILVSSLTKVFSGDSNVMGGSMIVSPSSIHHQTLKGLLDGDDINSIGIYEDTYFGEDAIYMERNSRNFRTRVAEIDRNAQGLCERLMELKNSEKNKIIKSIHYPRYTTPENYERCRRKDPPGGYGGLLSIVFHDLRSARTFYDHLQVFKGPSLGTNFTLCSPYVLLAHFNELEWAEQFGVEANLVRVSVGLEGLDRLLTWFQAAFERANELEDS